ncbi:type IX secretion system anionic LPS delivery protein PorZ [Maribellus maritimus]|uniref:type IX secretion system anionic LPS delivery protein PorZ n=1 Tax=Maribellus maritimus TaxID=2870838 RepID=UPI001EEA8CA4|nr:two-component regulator propeller domain-containing protein [Maribellus maritimus]MCG6188276.1 T9SS type A sorting domain-containing protein [Maribellus maritimus]
MNRIFLFTVSLVFVLQTQAQRSGGSWQDYLSYANAKKIAVAGEKVYCLSEGGLIYYDLQDNSINRIADVAELSDFGINTIAYSEENEILVIVYNNCNIDLLEGTTVRNISDLERKQITGEKAVNNISFIGDEAFLACSFGIVVLNLDRKEVKDTYIIGEGGTHLNINDVEILNDSVYAATDNGILKAYREDNLLDYTNWVYLENIPRSTGKFNFLEMYAGKLIANYTPEEWYADEMYAFDGESWTLYQAGIRYIYDIQENNNYLTIASRENVFIVDSNNSIVKRINNYQINGQQISAIQPRSVGMTSDGNIWIADYEKSLVKVAGESFEAVQINGPMDNDVFSLLHTGTNLWIMPGAQIGWIEPHFQKFGNDQWSYFSNSNHSELDGFFNVISVAVDPSDENHFFIGSWGGGLLEYKNDEFVERYTNHNSPLESALPQQPDEPYVRVDGMAFDSEGNLWISNSEAGNNLHKLSADGSWESFELPEAANDYNLGEVIVTENNDKWIVVRGNDLYVVNSSGTEKIYLPVTAYFNNGDYEEFNRMNDVYSIAEDDEGDIWVGTTKGVAVFSDASRIWDSETFYATQPSLDLNDGLFNPLLETETVTAIAVDGANRKWLGTSGSGVYLVSESGEKEILHFTEDNSPLLSNNITAIAINPNSGEVFFGTDEGLISYQGNATEGNDVYKNVYVYPNPVRETYDGQITVTGLIANTDVKITDITGNLVFQTESLGGQAVWDGTNLNGHRVKTGIYLVLCNDETGEQTHITKLLFIN